MSYAPILPIVRLHSKKKQKTTTPDIVKALYTAWSCQWPSQSWNYEDVVAKTLCTKVSYISFSSCVSGNFFEQASLYRNISLDTKTNA